MPLLAAFGASLVAGLVASGWTALALAGIGHFRAWAPMLAFFAAAVPAALILLRRRAPGARRGVDPRDLAAVGIGCATLFLTLPADEILLGGQDPGVYVHIASSVARNGSLLVEAPDVAAFTGEERELLIRPKPRRDLFPGMRVLPGGRLAPQFSHLFPSLMAVAWSIGGIEAALLVNPLLNVAAVIALYALASLLLGRGWALVATVVHALAPAQIRAAKLPAAEMAAQFFLLSGVALLAVALRSESPRPRIALLAGAALGAATLARPDSVIFLVPLGVLLLAGMCPAARTRPVLVALGTAGAFYLHSLVHQRLVNPFYHPLSNLIAAAFLAGAVLATAIVLARWAGAARRLGARLPRWEAGLRAAGAALVLGWVLFGWLVRPRLGAGGRIGRAFQLIAGDPPWSGAADLLAGPESRNVLLLADLVGPAGLLAALGGIAYLLLARRGLWETAWACGAAALLVAITVHIHDPHTLMWASRRFVPVVVPLLSVGIAAAAAALAGGGRPRPARGAAAAALLAAVLWQGSGATLAMARGREWPGLIAWYERLERVLPEGADLYSDQPGFAAPFRFISGRRAYELHSRDPERIERLVGLMRRRAAGGRVVAYLTEQPFADPAAQGLVPLAEVPLRSSILVQSRRGVTGQTKPRSADFVLYRVLP